MGGSIARGVQLHGGVQKLGIQLHGVGGRYNTQVLFEQCCEIPYHTPKGLRSLPSQPVY